MSTGLLARGCDKPSFPRLGSTHKDVSYAIRIYVDGLRSMGVTHESAQEGKSLRQRPHEKLLRDLEEQGSRSPGLP
jgi:hypothetical protein